VAVWEVGVGVAVGSLQRAVSCLAAPCTSQPRPAFAGGATSHDVPTRGDTVFELLAAFLEGGRDPGCDAPTEELF